MASKVLTPSPIAFTVSAALTLDKALQPNPTDFLSYRLNVYDAPLYRIKNGWPVALPKYDVHARTLVSAEGQLLSQRPGAQEVATTANVRWIADVNFDSDLLTWWPFLSDFGAVKWETSVDYLPTHVEEYTYSVNNRRVIKDAINFDHDGSQHMWANLDIITGASGYSIAMVCTVNSVYGNSEGQSFTGLVGNGSANPTAGKVSEDIDAPWTLKLVAGELRLDVGKATSTESIGISDLMANNRPFIVVVVLSNPKSKLYVATSSDDIKSLEIHTGSLSPVFSTELVLGRSFGDTMHTADMAVMDLGIYGASLTSAQVKTEVASLTKVYG